MMEHILRRYAESRREDDDTPEHENDAARLIADLVAQCRPPKAHLTEHASNAIQALCHVLNNNPELVPLLRDAVLSMLGEKKPVSLYVDSGIQPSSGFFSEMSRRFGHKLLPAAIDTAYLKDLFALIFPKVSDELWVLAVPDEMWLQLLQTLDFADAPDELLLASQQNLLDALQVLSYRLSASGLEPELIRNHPELEDHTSPFIMQNIELDDFLRGEVDKTQDAKHILVMLDQCREVIGKVRRNSSQTGTSLHLTFLLQRMSQQIQRLECLLDLLVNLRTDGNTDIAFIHLFKTLVSAECHKNDVRLHWRENMELLALRVTENASRTGEYYITTSRSEYFELLRSAMGAGLIIVVMAMIKLMMASQHYAPLTEAICFSLNYGLGFVLIHILHFTVATKQPAMTAAAIASSIDASDGKTKEMANLVDIIAQMMRSQIIAILGNVIVVIPVAMLIAALIYWINGFGTGGQHFVTPEKAIKLLNSVDPLHSGALFYAAIAGVCLFLSGLIAGYHDNIAVYNKIPQRLRALGWLQGLLGRPRLNRVADYVENNLGALAGNFYFGCMLGGMTAIGVLFGLPVDIRHITFSSAFVGFSLVGLDFAVDWYTVLKVAIGLMLIGAVNLTVSFSLALYVAMKSRKVTFMQWRLLVAALLARLVQEPRQFFLPPKKETAEPMGPEQRPG